MEKKRVSKRKNSFFTLERHTFFAVRERLCSAVNHCGLERSQEARMHAHESREVAGGLNPVQHACLCCWRDLCWIKNFTQHLL